MELNAAESSIHNHGHVSISRDDDLASIKEDLNSLTQQLKSIRESEDQNPRLREVREVPAKAQFEMDTLSDPFKKVTLAQWSQPNLSNTAADTMAKVLRQELQAAVLPILQTMAKTGELQQKCSEAVERLSFVIGTHIHELERATAGAEAFDHGVEGNSLSSTPVARNPQHSHSNIENRAAVASFRQRLDKVWPLRLGFGRLFIRLRSYQERGEVFHAYASPARHYFQLDVTFLPSSALGWAGCAHYSISDRPNTPGCLHVSQSLSSYNLHRVHVPASNKVGSIVGLGTVEELESLFARGLATPRDIFDAGHGASMLEVGHIPVVPSLAPTFP